MLTSRGTTGIALERGVEDRALHDELHKLITRAGFAQRGVDFYTDFPTVGKLLAALKEELRGEYE